MATGIDVDGAVGGCATVRPTASVKDVVIVRNGPVQPTRRAVLHVHALGDPDVPPGLMSWYTERGFQFYLAVVRLPVARMALRGPVGLAAERVLRQAADRPAGWLAPFFSDLDAATEHLRDTDGMDDVFVTARGDGALPVALWTQARQSARAGQAERSAGPNSAGPNSGGPNAGGPNALILYEPVFPVRRGVCLHISCPVLVLTACGERPAGERPRGSRRPVPAMNLGAHVTWRQLPRTAGQPVLTGGAVGLQEVCGELGRWLGAYMYGQTRDQLL